MELEARSEDDETGTNGRGGEVEWLDKGLGVEGMSPRPFFRVGLDLYGFAIHSTSIIKHRPSGLRFGFVVFWVSRRVLYIRARGNPISFS